MFTPPPLTKPHFVYDDPSGVREPQPYLRAWHRREPRTRPALNIVRRARIAHREA
jgi:hypothetical protein